MVQPSEPSEGLHQAYFCPSRLAVSEENECTTEAREMCTIANAEMRCIGFKSGSRISSLRSVGGAQRAMQASRAYQPGRDNLPWRCNNTC
jgi:hypothetical protein